MRKEFKKFLIEKKNLPEFSVSGARSTASDYPFRIAHICKIENMGWDNLAANLNIIIPQYEIGGEKFGVGRRSHTSFIQALRYFRVFVREQVNVGQSSKSVQNQRKWWRI